MIFNFCIVAHMVVCLCQGVSEKEVRQAIAGGASTRKQVTRVCGAGAGCGGCHESIQDLLHDAGRQRPGASPSTSSTGKATAYGVAVTAA